MENLLGDTTSITYEHPEQQDKIKFSRGMTGKYSYEISLVGKAEEQVKRIPELKEYLESISSQAQDIVDGSK